jgi:hypothetical protein
MRNSQNEFYAKNEYVETLNKTSKSQNTSKSKLDPIQNEMPISSYKNLYPEARSSSSNNHVR